MANEAELLYAAETDTSDGRSCPEYVTLPSEGVTQPVLDFETVVDFAVVTKKKNTAPTKSTATNSPEPQPSKLRWEWISAIAAVLLVGVTLWIQFDNKFGTIEGKLTEMSGRIGKLEGRFEQQDADQRKLNARLTQQEAISLTSIRATVQMAEKSRTALPAAQLADYKTAVQAVPLSVHEYWATVAAIINYQSSVNQMSGEAPDPAKVSKPCRMLTNEGNVHSFNNSFSGVIIENCVVDLDSNRFEGVVFKNSVVRYKGGPIVIRSVGFINCRFVLNLPEDHHPAQPEQEFLLALLQSPDQKNVQVGK